jgi:chromosome segregation protein
VHFQRLKLTGFKSFVDPTEFRIEKGLTGVVGPNGCGKSNLLEGLRWVMGANSAKALRGAGMEDVIFAGSGRRPPRSWAEAVLTIDNAERRAPQPFAAEPVLEISRRIDRGGGSTYRVNGKEVRARDVQLLFADASTGANSPALVRQGQISELIAAKPQNRRRILEEAGGVSGLHARRHEAELKLRAAETNLTRLEDVTREIEATLGRLKREARQAEKYKKVSAEIRALQGAVLYARWCEAKAAHEKAEAELRAAAETVAETARLAAAATTEAANAAEALKPLREEDAIAAAVLHRLTLERDRLETEARHAQGEVDRLRAELVRLAADREREDRMVADAAQALERLVVELETLEAEAAAAPEHGPELRTAAETADQARAAAEAAVERLASRLAAEQARAAAEAARARDAAQRLQRAEQAFAAARGERAAVGLLEDPRIETARAALADALEALQAARAAVEAAEAARSEAAAAADAARAEAARAVEQARAEGVRAESSARQAAREHEDRLGRLRTEARGLAQLLTGTKREFPPALDSVRAQKGYEAALAAALGDDLDAALDPRAAAHWAGAAVAPPTWPLAVEPLSDHVEAPPALAARLAYVGVCERADAERLRPMMHPGARLVSREGDLWRWDGFVALASAPKPAAVRLAQRTRLAEVETEIAALEPAAAEAAAALKAATEAAAAALKAAQDAAAVAQKDAAERLRLADEALRAARAGPAEAERAVARAREQVEALTRDLARREARAQALDETVDRLEAERREARAAADAARAESAAPEDLDALRAELQALRARAADARQTAAEARAALETEARDRAAREGRLAALRRDREAWTRRAAEANERVTSLEDAEDRVRVLLARAEAAPETLIARRDALLDAFAAGEARRSTAADALNAGDAAAREADRASRAADAAAASAREIRAASEARHDAASARLAEVDAQVRDGAGLAPDDLGRKLKEDASAVPTDVAGAESLLYGLEREREGLGAVNLRAEEEATEYADRLNAMRSERGDLTTAIAKLRDGIDELNAEGRERLLAAFDVINTNFQSLFATLFGGGQAELKLVESDDPLEAGLEIFACPPGKRLSTMSLMSGGEQALTAAALIFGVFLANPAPVCVLDEVDAPLDDANVDRFCRMLDEMRRRTETRFIVITHNPVTMSRMDRLFGVTMAERGVSQLVTVDLGQAEALVAAQ